MATIPPSAILNAVEVSYHSRGDHGRYPIKLLRCAEKMKTPRTFAAGSPFVEVE